MTSAWQKFKYMLSLKKWEGATVTFPTRDSWEQPTSSYVWLLQVTFFPSSTPQFLLLQLENFLWQQVLRVSVCSLGAAGSAGMPRQPGGGQRGDPLLYSISVTFSRNWSELQVAFSEGRRTVLIKTSIKDILNNNGFKNWSCHDSLELK